MGFDTTDLDAACLDLGDEFNAGAFLMVPTFSEETSNTDGFSIAIGERLTAQTTQAVITANSIERGTTVTHDRTGNEFEVLGYLADDVEWVTVQLERI